MSGSFDVCLLVKSVRVLVSICVLRLVATACVQHRALPNQGFDDAMQHAVQALESPSLIPPLAALLLCVPLCVPPLMVRVLPRLGL